MSHLKAFGPDRRYGTLVACILEAMTMLTDEVLEMHERFLGQQFKKAERKHLGKFQENDKAINNALKLYATLGRALIEAKTRNRGLWNNGTPGCFSLSLLPRSRIASSDGISQLSLPANRWPGTIDILTSTLRLPESIVFCGRPGSTCEVATLFGLHILMKADRTCLYFIPNPKTVGRLKEFHNALENLVRLLKSESA